jgi:hypothetical protein
MERTFQEEPSSRKRKLPEWIMSMPAVEEEEPEETPVQKQRRDAQRALEILEAMTDDDDDGLQPQEEEEAFCLSQSAVMDEMSSEEALALLGDAYEPTDDREQLICDLEAALCASAS